ncbi:hypothetical protein VMCG_00683 [Cytospora schulzeri]|uniref:Uncharacterized protein n=1 Tax=Cytospora schulzeri TaxID=448051 RepID=A0A423X989_9PEZI|nr:hypothetical protein VMCG_00683 [Valsa malicola]
MAVNSRQPVRSTHSTPIPSPPRSTTTITCTRPTTPTSPVQIPTKSKRDSPHSSTHRNHRNHDDRRRRSSSPRWREVHSPDAIPPSVAALLAVTSIPPPKSQRTLRQRLAKDTGKRMTVDSILQQGQESEKELSLNFIKGPLDVLLSPPEELEDDDLSSIAGSTIASPLSTRTVSYDSMPSLTDSFSTGTTSSSIGTTHSTTRGRKMQPTRKSLTPVSSPPGEREEHPLFREQDLEELDFRVFDNAPDTEEKKGGMMQAFQPFRSAFKSNLTSSLRALRNAARSFSSMNMSSIPPEDFLTRSILTLEPNVPFTDERMPPALDEEPSAAVRRYLNPTQTARLESQGSTALHKPRGSYTASIQMQTYRVHRSRSAPSGLRGQSATSRSSQGEQPARGKDAVYSSPPGPRQREMRENSDFIRVAVMEMAMRKSGKLDEQQPGRARWALPPRKTSTRPYEIRGDGIPARWVPATH